MANRMSSIYKRFHCRLKWPFWSDRECDMPLSCLTLKCRRSEIVGFAHILHTINSEANFPAFFSLRAAFLYCSLVQRIYHSNRCLWSRSSRINWPSIHCKNVRHILHDWFFVCASHVRHRDNHYIVSHMHNLFYSIGRRGICNDSRLTTFPIGRIHHDAAMFQN